MRITIDTDDKGNVNIDTGDKGTNKPGLFESTTDIPVIDAGSAPLEYLALLSNVATEGESLSLTPSPQDPKAQLPLNPLRAGATAAYQSAANQRMTAAAPPGSAAAYQGTPADHDPSIAATDGGRAARIPDNKSSDAPKSDRRSAKTAKSSKKR
jgi:hypothetical protein